MKKIPLPKPLQELFLGFALKQLKHTIFMFHAFVLDHLFPYQMVRNKELQQGQVVRTNQIVAQKP